MNNKKMMKNKIILINQKVNKEPSQNELRNFIYSITGLIITTMFVITLLLTR